ncbi:hypothetical protein A7Q10_07150 [Methylacidiphilum caldifontis]|uniref:Uncharacterized protein n=1 Tax=Methylacidiphilum caldifontis TaxID=2795386 RepID=A0A4Y8PDM9_9BACT|nr:hypothetical protein A7Q10_07150 [Methylacidiphilum caldifontis]
MHFIHLKDLNKKTQIVCCPFCGNTQTESKWALSTFCKKCGHYIGLASKKEDHLFSSVFLLPKTRELTCPYCNHSQKIYAEAISVGCSHCGAYLYVENLYVKGKIKRKLSTLGDIQFGHGSEYSGPAVQGRKIWVRGIIHASIKALEEIEFSSKCMVKGIVHSPRVVINRFCSVKVKEIISRELIVKGVVECEKLIARDFLKIESFGHLTTEKILTNRLVAEPFSHLEAEFKTYSSLCPQGQKNFVELGEERLFWI